MAEREKILEVGIDKIYENDKLFECVNSRDVACHASTRIHIVINSALSGSRRERHPQRYL